MPRSISALSAHKLFSEYRGPRILNELAPTPTPAPTPSPTPEPTPSPEPTPAQSPKPDDHEGRITDLDNKNKELKKKLKEFEDAEKKRLEDEAKARGEHEKLAEQYKNESATEKAAREAAEARAARFEAQMKKQIDEQIKAISDAEKQKKITELLGEKPVEEQMEMLPNLFALMGVAPQSFGGPTPASTTTPDKTDLSAKRSRHKELIDKTIAGTISGSERAEKHRLEIELSDIFQKEQEAKTAK